MKTNKVDVVRKQSPLESCPEKWESRDMQERIG